MIRIETETDALYAAIAAHRPSWLAKAKSRKAMFRRMGRYVEGQDFWGEIKDIYIELQHEKCAYCETRLAGRELGSKVHEVEHFRPKSRVKTWPPASGKGAVGFVPPCRLGRASRRGYYLLAYHPLNYVIACTRCNSTLKADYFPIRGARGTGAAHPQTAMAEDPLLIYPLGHLDVDPASLIRFEGVLAVPRHGRGRDFERALVTIAFFQLNHQDLCSRRARLLGALWLSLRTLDTPGLPAVLIQYHQHAVDAAQDAAGEFAACARDFVALHRSDPALADQLGEAAAAMSR